MALERIVSNKHFSGNYTDEEILNLFSQDEDIKYGEVIVFNDKTNPSIYFLDEYGELASIQKISVDDGSDLDDLMDSIRYVAEDLKTLETTYLTDKEELELKLANFEFRIKSLEDGTSGGTLPEGTKEQIDKNTEDIKTLSENINDYENRLISNENKVFLLEEEIEENELVHSAGITTLNASIKELSKRVDEIEGGDIDIDLTEIENKIGDIENNVQTLSGKTDDLDIRLKSIEEGNLNIDLTPIEDKLKELENNDTVINGEISGITDNINIITENINTINSGVTNIDERLKTIEEGNIENINNKIIELENEDIKIKTSISDLKNNDIKPLKQSVTTLETTVVNHSQRLSELEKIDLYPLENDINLLKEDGIKVHENLNELNDKTSNLKAVLDDLSEEVNENELVHSAGLTSLYGQIKEVSERVKNIEDNGSGGGSVDVDLTDVYEKIDVVSGNTVSLDERVKAIEDGQVEVDLTEVNSKIDTISGETVTLKTQYGQLLKIDENFEERIDALEEKPDFDLTPIENKVTELENFDINIEKELNTVKETASNALTRSSESLKIIEVNENELITIDVNIKDRKATLTPEVKVVNIVDASDVNDGIAMVMDIKSEIERVAKNIDSYNVNGKVISENPVLNGEDINLTDKYLESKPDDSQNVMSNDTIEVAIAKLEKKLDIVIQVFTTSLNELNDRLKELENK